MFMKNFIWWQALLYIRNFFPRKTGGNIRPFSGSYLYLFQQPSWYLDYKASVVGELILMWITC